MRRAVAALALALAAVPAGPTASAAADPRDARVSLRRVASGLSFPTVVAAPRDSTGRLFIGEKQGRIRVRWPGERVRATPYLDIRSRVSTSGERGLLGIAFHPSFSTNRYVFVSYTDPGGDVRISRFRASSPTANTLPASSEVVILEIEHSEFNNHNGGQLVFGSRYLYISTGDGGGGGDPHANAQNRSRLLGKILRIDVDRTCGSRRYCVPASNPYAGSSSFRGEIWHYGLRNPWRFSFDRDTGTQWIADVGQASREEINRAGSGVAPRNWGWDCREGTLVSTSGGSYCSGRSFSDPLREYSHTSGRCSVIGGHVYRGNAYPALAGVYVYGDYCSGEIWGLGRDDSGNWVNALLYDASGMIVTFGESARGELYLASQGGSIYRVTATRR